MASKKKSGKSGKKSKGSGGKKSTKFGKIFGKMRGEGMPGDEAAAVAYYYTDGKESIAVSFDLEAAAQKLRESLEKIERKSARGRD